MKQFLLISVLLGCLCLAGCFYIGQERMEDVIRNPPSEWSSRDCLTVILTAMVHNLNAQESNIELVAMPLYPSVVMALNQIQLTQHHWSEYETKLHMDEFLKGTSGFYVDWRDGKLVNSKGNHFKDQTDMDSLLIIITLTNKTHPCAVPTTTVVRTETAGNRSFTSEPLFLMSDLPCYTPTIFDIDRRIWLLNGDGDTLRPKYVVGRRHETLTSSETLFAMFPLWNGSKHFLKETTSAELQVDGFDTQMKFAMNTAKMR